jgi:hypothetical protein
MWEYKTETFDSVFDSKKSLKEKSNIILASAGEDGWELVNFQCAGAFGSMMIFIFKRKFG